MSAALASLISLAVGIAIGWTAARVKVGKREAMRRDLTALTRPAVDLEPCEFSGYWRERL